MAPRALGPLAVALHPAGDVVVAPLPAKRVKCGAKRSGRRRALRAGRAVVRRKEEEHTAGRIKPCFSVSHVFFSGVIYYPAWLRNESEKGLRPVWGNPRSWRACCPSLTTYCKVYALSSLPFLSPLLASVLMR